MSNPKQHSTSSQTKTRRITALSLTTGILLLPLMIGGCPFTLPDLFDLLNPPDLSALADPDPNKAQLRPFNSTDEIVNYARERHEAQLALQRSNSSGVTFFGAVAETVDLASDGDVGFATDSGGDEAGDPSAADDAFTNTNLQEQGVDEADVMKSDGEYFYIARYRELKIVDVNPADAMATTATLTNSSRISDMYLLGDTLIVIGYDWETTEYDDVPRALIWPPYFNKALTTVSQYDVTDRTAPALVAHSTLEGSIATSRLVDGKLILVLTQTPTFADNDEPQSFEEIAPTVTIDGATSSIGTPDTWYYPLNPDGLYTTAVLSLDATNVESILGSLTVLAGAGTIYMSTEALYLTDLEYAPNAEVRELTAIHKITFDPNGVPEYVASGKVPGRLLNQFSLSEYEDALRVATHVDNNRWFGWGWGGVDVILEQSNRPDADFNAVYVLTQDGFELNIAGRVENLAPGEQIYAARFLGTRGFVVTFRQVDPLFTLDLSDPNNPQVLGELKIPGFSEYLHPIDENTLIGVGQSVELAEWGGALMNGVQISLFDVSDLSNPTVIEQQTLGGRGSRTDVSYTHKAFVYLPETQVMAFPASLEDYWDSTFENEAGIYAYHVDPNSGFTPMAQLSNVNNAGYYGYGWRRPAIIGETLYAISSDGVRALNFANTETVFEVAFPTEETDN